jgi:arginine-tRNA-protein transferase
MTRARPCPYLPKRQERDLVADPGLVSAELYESLAKLGFRRSGEHLYRPHCGPCGACQSLRISIPDFRPGRSLLRNLSRNDDLRMRLRRAAFRPEYQRLYRAYQEARHGDGPMSDEFPEDVARFFSSSWSDTSFAEIELGGKLLAVAVTDRLGDGLSAVYTFYDPAYRQRSLGTWAILQQIEWARREGLPWLYLGYWVADCPKLSYKARFKPHQIFVSGRWQWAYDATGAAEPTRP